jgi:hypothetical protein
MKAKIKITDSMFLKDKIFPVDAEEGKIYFSAGGARSFYQRSYSRDNYCPSLNLGFRFLVEAK